MLSLCACLNKWNRQPESLCISHTTPACLHLSGATLFPKTCGLPCSPGQLVIRDKTTHQMWLSKFSWRHSHSFPPFVFVPVTRVIVPVTVSSSSCLSHCLAHVHSQNKPSEKKQYLSKPTFFGASRENFQLCSNLDSLVWDDSSREHVIYSQFQVFVRAEGTFSC